MPDDVFMELLREFRVENKEAHEVLFRKLDLLNGRTKTLELWRARLIGIAFGAPTIVLGLFKLAVMLKEM